MSNPPPLKSLHDETALVISKLELFRKLTTEVLVHSLQPGESGLKVRPDGTILDGHHRVAVLRERNFDVNTLPREIVRKIR